MKYRPDKVMLSKWKVVAYSGIALGVILVVCALVLLSFPELYVNKYLKNRIINEFSSTYPGYSLNISELHFNLLENSIEFSKIEVNSYDSIISCSISRSSLRGIGWLQLILNKDLVSGALAGSVANSQEIVVNLKQSQYEFHCGGLQISLKDSTIVANGLELHPLTEGKQLFDSSRLVRTRLSMVLPQIKVSGLSSRMSPIGKKYHAGFIRIPDLSLDVLVNKYKPDNQDTSISFISKGMLDSLKDIFQFDSLSISKGEINYAESDSDCSNTAKELTNGQTGYSISISEMNSNIFENHTEFGSVIFNSNDSTFSCSIDSSSFSGIDWLRFLWKRDIDSEAFAGAVANVHEIDLKSQNLEYEFRSGQLHISFPDSEIVANDLEVHPLVDDNQFFDESNFRRTRYSMALPQLKVSGLACLELLQGKIYYTRSIQISDASLDVLVSKYKPHKQEVSKTLMPNEMFASIKEIINIDSIIILNGRLIYGERFTARANPAVVRFDNSYMLAKGISNNENCGDTMVIHANSTFMNEGQMKLLMYVPLKSTKFSMQYSGSVSSMQLNKLNSFLEIAEHKRIKSGIIHLSSCDIQVTGGHAKGNVRAVYNDFTLALLDSQSGSEKGVLNKIKSFLANNFKIHGTNKKDESGSLKLGKVNYSRKQDDTFIQFAWYALRSGITDIGGF